MFDSGLTFWKQQPRTKKKTIIDYVSLYAGPEVQIHIRYSALLN